VTISEQTAEFNYRYNERLALLCGTEKPSTQQIQIAFDEAEKSVQELLKNENK